MRRALVSLAILSVLMLLVASIAGAQTKISGAVQCAKADIQQKADVGDRPNHSFMLSQAKCTWTKPLEIGDTKNTTGLDTAFDEVRGNTSHTHGQYVDNMANGDKAFVSYQGTATFKDGVPQTLKGTWTYTGGTGKLKGLKGKGTYKGTFAADGTVSYEVEGEYELPKM